MFLYAFFLRKKYINIVYTFIFLLFIKLPCATAPTVTYLFICIFPSFFGDLSRAGTGPAPTTFAINSFFGRMQYAPTSILYVIFICVNYFSLFIFNFKLKYYNTAINSTYNSGLSLINQKIKRTHKFAIFLIY